MLDSCNAVHTNYAVYFFVQNLLSACVEQSLPLSVACVTTTLGKSLIFSAAALSCWSFMALNEYEIMNNTNEVYLHGQYLS